MRYSEDLTHLGGRGAAARSPCEMRNKCSAPTPRAAPLPAHPSLLPPARRVPRKLLERRRVCPLARREEQASGQRGPQRFSATGQEGDWAPGCVARYLFVVHSLSLQVAAGLPGMGSRDAPLVLGYSLFLVRGINSPTSDACLTFHWASEPHSWRHFCSMSSGRACRGAGPGQAWGSVRPPVPAGETHPSRGDEG